MQWNSLSFNCLQYKSVNSVVLFCAYHFGIQYLNGMLKATNNDLYLPLLMELFENISILEYIIANLEEYI